MSERKEITIGEAIGKEARHQLREVGRQVSFEKARILYPRKRELSYRGIKGEILSYYDGLNQDHLVFLGFPSGSKWEKLKRSISLLKGKTDYGIYEVKAENDAEKAKITLSYFDEDYPKSFSPGVRFRRIWQDLMRFLPKGPGLVEKGSAKVIKDFNLRDLLVED